MTRGILEREATVCAGTYKPEIEIRVIDKNNDAKYYRNNDWHKTKIDAENRAKEMQAKKIKSLEKQLEKIRELKF